MKPKTVLVVDDEPSVREVLKRLLLEEGYDVLLAADGMEALDLIEAERPDLVLLDLTMPRMGGLAVCRRLKESPATRRLPIIMITALGEAADEVEGLETGADDYILKPFDAQDVRSRVAGLFRRCGPDPKE